MCIRDRYEGYLFPDTYEFYLYEDAEVVVKKMMDNFEKKMTSDLQSRIKASGMTFNEVMTLASIVQGEAGDLSLIHISLSTFCFR